MQVLLLRMRLLAIRVLLRGVIALRSVLRRRQRAARMRVAPWVTILIGRQRPLASSIHIFAACALTGFITAWQYERGNWAPSRTTDAVSKNSAVKPRGGEGETKTAIENKNPNASSELTQTIPAAPHVVLLNPGTADHQASPQAPAPPAPTPAKNNVSRPTSHKKASEDRPSQRPRRPTQSYEDLRDYVLRR